jgi:hypothetical protein
MITVRDNERESIRHISADEEHRRKGLCFLNSLQVCVHVRIVPRQKRELSGAQQILRGMFEELRTSKALDERVGFPVGTQKGKIFECGVEIRVFLLLAPLQF